MAGLVAQWPIWLLIHVGGAAVSSVVVGTLVQRLGRDRVPEDSAWAIDLLTVPPAPAKRARGPAAEIELEEVSPMEPAEP